MKKARYWLDQIKWSDEKVKEKGIDLETVEARIRELIEGDIRSVDGRPCNGSLRRYH
jgi:hypothetical protein